MSLMYTGCLPDPVDRRDHPYSWIATTSVMHHQGHHRIPSIRHPLDQRRTSSCVGHGWARWLTTLADLCGVHIAEPSAAFIYAHARLVAAGGDWSILYDAGTNIRAGAKAMAAFGVPPADCWPLDESKINQQPSDLAYVHAHDQRVKLGGYYRCGSVQEIENAIRANRPVVIGVEIHTGWYTPPEVLDAPGPGMVAGRHAVLLDEIFGDGTFGGLNSWGLWNGNGRFRLTRRYVAEGHDPWTGTLTFET